MKGKIIKNIPEIFMLISTILYWTMAGWTINPFAILFIIALSAQIYFRRKDTGIALALIFCFMFCFLFLALFSDVVKYENLSDASEMIIGGTLYLGTSLGVSIWMLVNYLKTPYSKENLVSK